MKTADLKTLYKSIESKIAKHYPGISERRFLQQFTNFEIDEKTLTDKLLLGVPLEYITRSSFFYQSEFYVNEDVLIPRCETEILVEKAYHLSHRFKDENKKINVIDVGTGCGAIIASFAKIYEGEANYFATDISQPALDIAIKNCIDLDIKFYKTDRFENIDETFDIILTNPPYIDYQSDREKVHPQVDKYEPDVALYIKGSYGSWFETFLLQIKEKLNPGGFCLMEGHEDRLKSLSKLAAALGFAKSEIIQDYTGVDRFLHLES